MLVVPSIYLLIGGYTRPANYTAELLEKLRARHGPGGAKKRRRSLRRRNSRPPVQVRFQALEMDARLMLAPVERAKGRAPCPIGLAFRSNDCHCGSSQ